MTTARIPLRVQASAGRNELVGLRDGVLVVRVAAPAIDGRANESLRRLLAKRFHVPRSAVTIVRGHHSRDKVIEIHGLDESRLLDAIQQ